ncbi:MAG: helix-turn-helix transcriptional regulator [Rhizobiales bacterium]|nr:helix-turn-helix transcriptional regulator [Hyphomicrobiales bacterium]
MLDGFAAHFAAGRSEWSDREFDRLSNQLLDLIVLAVIEPGQGIAANETSARTAHRERALRHIRGRLADRGLTPTSVAEACGVSRAYLHEIFRAGGDAGVEETIVAERLDRARSILTAPGASAMQIAAIAYRVGFSDPAHFSRAFRRRFGCSPREAKWRAGEPSLGQ